MEKVLSALGKARWNYQENGKGFILKVHSISCFNAVFIQRYIQYIYILYFWLYTQYFIKYLKKIEVAMSFELFN